MYNNYKISGYLKEVNKSWRQHPTRQQLYGHLPPITKTIQFRRTRHAGHCWRSRDELIRDVLLWNPTYGWAKTGRPARTYIQQLCEDTGCSPKDPPEAMNDRVKCREWVRDIRASGTTWWWWKEVVTEFFKTINLILITKVIQKINDFVHFYVNKIYQVDVIYILVTFQLHLNSCANNNNQFCNPRTSVKKKWILGK